MNCGILNKILIFSVGAAIGSVITWKLVKTKYERIAQEEIDSVKEVYSKKIQKEVEMETYKTMSSKYDTASDECKVTSNLSDLDTSKLHYVKLPENHIVIDFDIKNEEVESDNKDEEEEKDDMITDGPYVISPDEFGNEFDYEEVSLTYYADGVLTDDQDNIIEDVDGLVGLDSLNHFGEYEDDSVFVRNDALQTDYEILADLRNYSDICTVFGE